MDRKTIGAKGESVAARYLIEKGYKIIERNWGSKWGEIDLIAASGVIPEVYVFVEVKTKVGEDFGTPEEMINRSKLAQIQKMASAYDSAKNKPKRLDVVAVVLDYTLKPTRVDHYENVYF